MTKKTKNIVFYVFALLVCIIVILPATRVYLQRALIKTGIFSPKLEEPKNEEAAAIPLDEPEKNTQVSFKDEMGNIVQVSDLKGKVVFMNFWATWCPPCRAEMPSIQKLYDKFKSNKDIVFLIVEIEGEKEKAHQFMKKENLSLPVAYPNSPIPEEWVGGAIPTTVILAKNGSIAARHEGMADYSSADVQEFINTQLNK